MGYSLAFFNTTPPVPAISVADWYIMPSNVADKITKLALFSYKVVAEPNSPCPGFNCTYRTEIVAPWYNCTPAKFSDPGSPFEANDFVPLSKPVGSSLEDGESDKNYIYRSSLGVGQSEYKIPQDDYNSLVYTTQGIIDSDPDLWIGYVVNTTTLLPKGSDPRWTHKMEQHAAKCVHQKAKYSIDSVWVNNRLDSRKATVTNGVELLKDGERVGPEIDQEEYKGFIPYYT